MTNDLYNRMSSHQTHGNTNDSSNNETTAAKLAVLGGLLSTLGDALSTMAAALALEELQQAQNNSNANNDRISELEKQIKFLTQEINQQKGRRR